MVIVVLEDKGCGKKITVKLNLNSSKSLISHLMVIYEDLKPSEL